MMGRATEVHRARVRARDLAIETLDRTNPQDNEELRDAIAWSARVGRPVVRSFEFSPFRYTALGRSRR